jgi:pyruvate-formate lyase
VAGFLSWQMHGVLGRSTAATPDGRQAGHALSDSLAAVQGMARRGPTAMLETVEQFDLTNAIGAVVVNVTIPTGRSDGKLVAAIKTLIQAHFAKGGFELQFNVMSKEQLQAARENPEEHRDILVRVGGYSDYFVNLTEELQEEILQRFGD